MFIFPEILLFCLFLFLYCLFVLAKDDFMLLRKNVTLEHLFNTTFIACILGILAGRIGHIIEAPSLDYFNPLVFLLFPYFPGLSLATAIIGAVAYLWWSTRKKKFPFGRMLDIYVCSFLVATSVGILGLNIADMLVKKFSLFFFLEGVGIVMLASIFIMLFIKNKLEDGSIGFLGISLFSLIEVIFHIVEQSKKINVMIRFENIFLVVICIGSFILFLKEQHMFSQKKK